jgi:hypothetical protein
MAGQREIDGMRNLRRQTVVSERRDQANYCARNSNRDGNEIRAGEGRCGREPVKSATNLFDLARVPERVKRPRVNAEPDRVRRTQHAAIEADNPYFGPAIEEARFHPLLENYIDYLRFRPL